ncbi:MAG: hypothetical protein K2O45_04375 [Oscillospiraceae bacterium]|nr:hypothetical protein [Oscillospiraceae bacterium]
MIQCKKRVPALLLALCMLLSLAACGKDKEDDAQQLSGTVYVPEFIDLDLDILGKDYDLYGGGCTDGTNVYLLANIYPDWEAGEEGDARYAIIRIPLDGGEAVELENFQSGGGDGEDGSEVNRNFSSIRAGMDGSLWLEESTYTYIFELPEDFDPETDSQYNYVTDSVRKEYQVQLDSTGTEITRIDTSDLEEKAGMDGMYYNGTVVDQDGDIIVCGNQKVVVLDSSMNVRFTIEDSNLRGGNLVQLSDGTIGATIYMHDSATQTSSAQLRSIDKAAKGWGESYDLPVYASYNLYTGGGDYLFYYQNGDALYGYRAEAKDGASREERLLSWLEADINSEDIQFFSFLADGRVVVMTNSWRSSGSRTASLAILTATDRSQLPEKTTLTYATMGLGSSVRNQILEFNKTSSTHRIEVTDYSEYATNDDYAAGLTRLNTEILAGKVPDIISVSGMPIRQYGAKGLLEDLWPYIEQDTEIGGRAGVMERVFTAAEQEGKLYQIFDSFSISTVVGSRKMLGDRTSWTLAELQEALASMPEGCAIFGDWDTKENMLQTVLSMNMDSYVDWSTGTCSFDGDAFKAALEFCNSFPAEYTPVDGEYDDEDTRIREGRQMLSRDYISGFESIQRIEATFGGPEAINSFYMDYSGGYPPTVSDVPVKNDWGYSEAQDRLIPGRYITYIGYPREDGKCGSTFEISGGLAMSSTCKDKDGAWQFMREILLPVDEEESGERWNWNHWGFPANKAQFDKFVAEAMEVEYMTDADGNPILDPNGDPVQEVSSGYGYGDNRTLWIQATTQEEYDQIMELYNAIDSISSSDNSIFDIVKDVAGSYFAGDKSLDETAELIQNRVNIYVNENR